MDLGEDGLLGWNIQADQTDWCKYQAVITQLNTTVRVKPTDLTPAHPRWSDDNGFLSAFFFSLSLFFFVEAVEVGRQEENREVHDSESCS